MSDGRTRTRVIVEDEDPDAADEGLTARESRAPRTEGGGSVPRVSQQTARLWGQLLCAPFGLAVWKQLRRLASVSIRGGVMIKVHLSRTGFRIGTRVREN
ncbi:hypothetical protein Tco_0689585 [Tanacetum coccineum]